MSLHRFACVALVDPCGRLLMQERDENAPVDPDRWCLPGGGLEAGETWEQAAYRELAEETGVVLDTGLEPAAEWTYPSPVDGADLAGRLFAGATDLTDADIVCGEGRRIVFVEPDTARGLDLAAYARFVVPAFLDSELYRRLRRSDVR